MTHLKKAIFALALVTAPASFAADKGAQDLCRETGLLYAHYSDTGQREKFGELFVEDGVLITGGQPRYPAQVITEADRQPRTTRHVVSNHIVREDDGEITGTSYFIFFFNAEVSDAALPMTGQPAAMGVYHDVYTVEDGKCKFKRREAKASFAGR